MPPWAPAEPRFPVTLAAVLCAPALPAFAELPVGRF